VQQAGRAEGLEQVQALPGADVPVAPLLDLRPASLRLRQRALQP
jgi:hypothetical protein